jgi:hypothetical protein
MIEGPLSDVFAFFCESADVPTRIYIFLSLDTPIPTPLPGCPHCRGRCIAELEPVPAGHWIDTTEALRAYRWDPGEGDWVLKDVRAGNRPTYDCARSSPM